MPIYDYVCSTCATRTEVIHGIDAPAPRFCPSCGADGTLRKVFVTPAVHFKGSGWAKKDRSSSSASRTKASAADGSGDSKSPSSDGSPGASTSNAGTGDGASSDGGSNGTSKPASAEA